MQYLISIAQSVSVPRIPSAFESGQEGTSQPLPHYRAYGSVHGGLLLIVLVSDGRKLWQLVMYPLAAALGSLVGVTLVDLTMIAQNVPAPKPSHVLSVYRSFNSMRHCKRNAIGREPKSLTTVCSTSRH